MSPLLDSSKTKNDYSVIGFRLFLLLLLGITILGVVSYFIPNSLLEKWFVLIAPDRTTRPLNPLYIRSAASIISLVSFLLILLLAAYPTLYSKTVSTSLKVLRSAYKIIHQHTLQFLKETPNPILIGLCAVLVVGITLRVDIVITKSAGPDEAINFIYFASRTLLDILSDYHIPNNHVLHTLFSHVSYYTFGETLTAFRAPALIAGSLCILVSFWLARRLFDSETALLVSGLMAVIPPMLEFSGDARGYTLVTLFFLVAFVMATYLRDKYQPFAWSIFVVSLSLGIFTIPIAVYGALLISAWLLVSVNKTRLRSIIWELAIAAVSILLISTIFYSLIIIRSGVSALFTHSQTKALPLIEVMKKIPQLIMDTNSCWAAPHDKVIGILLFAGFLIALLLPSEKRKTAWYLILAIIVSMTPLLFIQRIIPSVRFINYLVPVFLCVVAYGYRRLFIVQSHSKPASSQVILAILSFGLCTAWAFSIYNISRYSCIENGFQDAEVIAKDYIKLLGEDDVLVANRRSGIASPTRYYLMEIGASPRRLFAYTPWREQDQLQHYRRLFVIVRDCESGLMELGFSKNNSSAEFSNPQLLASYPQSCVFLIERHKDIPLKASPYPEDPWGFPVLF